MIDLSFLEQFTKGDKKKMKRYINIYLSIAPKTFQVMKKNLQEEDWDQLRINAHSLKPQADYMGIPSLKAALVNIESQSKGGNKTILQKLFQNALKFHKESEASLKRIVSRL